MTTFLNNRGLRVEKQRKVTTDPSLSSAEKNGIPYPGRKEKE